VIENKLNNMGNGEEGRGTGMDTKEEGRGVKKEQGIKEMEEVKKKRGRRRKDEPVELVNPKDQNKYFIDVSKEPENKELILNILVQANQKELGREITFKDLVFAALPKLSQKDIERIQESCLSEMEKVERALSEFNKKNETKLTMGEFLVRKLGIN
jgi:hypothetical protein